MKPVFAKQKWASSQQPQRRVSLCGLWSREHTQFFVKRPQRSKNAGEHRTPAQKKYTDTPEYELPQIVRTVQKQP